MGSWLSRAGHGAAPEGGAAVGAGRAPGRDGPHVERSSFKNAVIGAREEGEQERETSAMRESETGRPLHAPQGSAHHPGRARGNGAQVVAPGPGRRSHGARGRARVTVGSPARRGGRSLCARAPAQACPQAPGLRGEGSCRPLPELPHVPAAPALSRLRPQLPKARSVSSGLITFGQCEPRLLLAVSTGSVYSMRPGKHMTKGC